MIFFLHQLVPRFFGALPPFQSSQTFEGQSVQQAWPGSPGAAVGPDWESAPHPWTPPAPSRSRLSIPGAAPRRRGRRRCGGITLAAYAHRGRGKDLVTGPWRPSFFSHNRKGPPRPKKHDDESKETLKKIHVTTKETNVLETLFTIPLPARVVGRHFPGLGADRRIARGGTTGGPDSRVERANRG